MPQMSKIEFQNNSNIGGENMKTNNLVYDFSCYGLYYERERCGDSVCLTIDMIQLFFDGKTGELVAFPAICP